ncbi:transcriptional regulator [Cupriavidus basilensis]|uniref:Transcriptional regulator n=1 Tax=Cupriavidus basilensis TaxID=68895 RepID=A0ABT6B1B1_9BURK|nr:metalloregulator ArsR/SmtB family transcription factor [Cupriavidus basilensis]MDF3838665.1 transcriptional regulator [Cupriavidus basilensis]
MNYTIENLDNPAGSPGDRILFLLKTKGAASTAQIAQALGGTAEAARQQVQKLLAAGLIEGRQQSASGAGRPRQDWALTASGHGRFPDTHAQLTIQLIGSVRQLFGEQGLDKLIGQREAQTRQQYLAAVAGQDQLAQRLETLTELRQSEGYMARLERDGADWLLIEDHCPICAAAQTCQGFCRAELRIFQEVAGDGAIVTREEHLLSHARRCLYRVKAAA